MHRILILVITLFCLSFAPAQTITILIDPGHGGSDPGHESSNPNHLKEKDLNLIIAKKVGAYLNEKLGHVNLIVGKNNSGKSTVLEALALLASGFNPEVMLFISNNRNVYRHLNTKDIESKVFSIELPMTIAPYSQSSYYRDKYVIFSNLVGNNEDIPNTYWSGSSYPAWRSIGVGPTSLSINTDTMNDAAKYNGYVYLLQNPQIKDKDYSLKMTFRYSWGRA
jgi:hypothetical protein